SRRRESSFSKSSRQARLQSAAMETQLQGPYDHARVQTHRRKSPPAHRYQATGGTSADCSASDEPRVARSAFVPEELPPKSHRCACEAPSRIPPHREPSGFDSPEFDHARPETAVAAHERSSPRGRQSNSLLPRRTVPKAATSPPSAPPRAPIARASFALLTSHSHRSDRVAVSLRMRSARTNDAAGSRAPTPMTPE